MISREIRVLEQSQSALFSSIPHMTTLFEFTRVMNVRDETCQAFVPSSGPLGDGTYKFVHGQSNVWSANARQIRTFKNNLEAHF